MKSRRTVRLLIIGQTPPPYVGQMLSIENMVKSRFEDLRIYHTRMNYSQSVGEIGKVKVRKLFHLIRVIAESSYKILRHRVDVVYYPPGAGTVPLIRDILTLLVIRRCGARLMLVFHASGLSEAVSSWKGLPLWLFRKAFFFPAAAVQKSDLNPPDGAFVKAAAVYTVPNGLPDVFGQYGGPAEPHAVPVILFVGLVREDKGVGVLLAAARLLKEAGRTFLVRVMGDFVSEEYRRRVLRETREAGLEGFVEFCGPKVDGEKWALYRGADIFCFPSYYPMESFGNVVVEAMMFRLPVVSTLWRGIPGIVLEGETGFLVGVRDPAATAERLGRLLDDETLRREMGRKGRERYLEKFTLDIYRQAMKRVVLEVASKDAGAGESRGAHVREQATGRREAESS